MPLSVGDKLGPYEILAQIGVGGMGEVWKARDARLNRTVAIKRLKGQHSARFEQEARAIAALNHPHICQIHDIGADYLVLEYIEGSPLRGPLALPEALRIASQIASALEAAHAKGILHRDLKPGNILVTGNGAKLLDFGLAKMTGDEDATQTLAISGTPLYMSPEQAEGRPVDTRSDIFSFGAVLYELLIGQRAFDSLGAVLRDEPARLDSPAADIVKRCLAKQPGERFSSMAEVRAALEKLAARPAPEIPSIAVLPFANMSSDKEQEYFSDGLAEEILNLLAKIPALKVIARTSSFAFRGKEQDIRKIAEALDVKTILEGSVRRSGNRIRVTAQLIEASGGSHLWSERYDRELTDVFEVQDEMAAAISKALHLKLAPPAAAAEHKPSLPAYEAYLKGRHQGAKFTPASIARAQEYYEQAISLDPKFAPPYAELAGCYGLLASLGVQVPQEAMPQVQVWAQRALDLDPTLQDAHAHLGMKAASFDYDWREAERWFALALTWEPVPIWTCVLYTTYMLALGRAGEAERVVRRAVEADPLTPLVRHYLAAILWVTGRAGEAEGEWRHCLELDENFHRAWSMLGRLHLERGEMSEGLRSMEKAYSLAGFVPDQVGSFAGVLARTGNLRGAEELLGKLGPPDAPGVQVARAVFHLHQGEIEKAVDCWEKVIDQKNPLAILLPHFMGEALRTSPRWPALARRMNFPESAW